MLLEGKNAVIYDGGGSIGGAVARAVASEGASVFLAGRTIATLDEVAAFAASDRASIITGTAINITGGTVVD
jgi:3-oxoacyl-[acyl-carrier protein] reductase